MNSPDNENMGFSELERDLRKEHGFTRISPKQKLNGDDEEEKMSGVLHSTTTQMVEVVWKRLNDIVEDSYGIVPFMFKYKAWIRDEIAGMAPDEACVVLSRTMNTALMDATTNAMAHLDNFQALDMEALQKYMNYKGVLMMGGSSIGENTPTGHMNKGLKTGVTESWRLVAEACRVYKQQTGETIDAETLEEIALNSEPLLLKAASTHIRILTVYSTAINNSNAFNLDLSEVPYFRIVGEAPHRALEITPELAAKMHDGYYKTEKPQYSGCPALFAKGVHEANVISDMHRHMVLPAALHYLKPLLRSEEEE